MTGLSSEFPELHEDILYFEKNEGIENELRSEWDSEMWRQYGNPSMKLKLAHNNQELEVNPSELYGPIRTKVTAVTRFRNNTTQRQQLNNMLANVLPMFMSVMDQNGIKALGREIFGHFGINSLNEVFPPSSDYDAEARADAAIAAMLQQGDWVQPQEEENHAAWIPRLLAAAAQYKYTPGFDSEKANILLQHVEMRRQMQGRQQKALSQFSQNPAGPGEEIAGGAPPEGVVAGGAAEDAGEVAALAGEYGELAS